MNTCRHSNPATTAKKFTRLVASNNEHMGEGGMKVLGRLIGSGGCLELESCKPDDLDIDGLCRGLGDKVVKQISLKDCWNEPDWVESLLEILPRVSQEINLRGWKITESEEAEILDKLREIAKKGWSPTVVLDDGSLTADGAGRSSQGHHAQPNCSEEEKKTEAVTATANVSATRLNSLNLDGLGISDSQKKQIRDALEEIFKRPATAKESMDVASTSQSERPSCSGSPGNQENAGPTQLIVITNHNNIDSLNAMKLNFGLSLTSSVNESSVLNVNDQLKKGQESASSEQK